MMKTSPPGLEIKEVILVDPRAPALPTVVRSARYRVTILDPLEPGDIKTRLDALLASDTTVRDRRGKTYDLRPLIEELAVEPGLDGLAVINMQLSIRESATGRPDEVLLAIGLDPFSARIERTELVLDPSGS